MINEEIFGGLKSAIERGASLKNAMMSFFNSGYKREEIEEAARALIETKNEIPLSETKPVAPISTIITAPPKPVQKLPTAITPEPPQIKEKKSIFNLNQIIPSAPAKTPPVQEEKPKEKIRQKISGYGEEKPKEKIVVFVLISLLVFLIGLLASIFIFKNELINFFGSLLS